MIFKKETNKKNYFIKYLISLGVLGLFLTISLSLLSTSIYGVQYTDRIDKHFTSSSNYLWIPKNQGDIESIRINGNIYGEGDVYVNLIVRGNKYLIFGRLVSNRDMPIKNFIEIQEGTNIGLILEYGDGSWDRDNTGIVSNYEGIDFKLNPYFFSNYDPTNLCTLWEVFSVDNRDLNSECYGSSRCCNFLGHTPKVSNWKEDYVLLLGNLKSTSQNIVLARIVYYDGNNVDYSNHDGLRAIFVDPEVKEKMNLTSKFLYDSNNYILEIELKGNAIFHFKDVTYNMVVEKKENTDDKDPLVNQPTSFIPETPNYNYSENVNHQVLHQEILNDPTNKELEKISYKENIKIINSSIPLNYADKISITEENGSFHFFARGYSDVESIEINNDLRLSEIILNPKNMFDTWFKIELNNNSETYQSISFRSNYYDNSIINFKIPRNDLINKNLSIYSNNKKINHFEYKEDLDYKYFRVYSRLNDIDIILEELPQKNMITIIGTFLNEMKLNPLFYFLFSIFFCLVILVLYNIPLKAYEKYKSFRFVEKEIKLGKKLINEEEQKMMEFLRKRHLIHEKNNKKSKNKKQMGQKLCKNEILSQNSKKKKIKTLNEEEKFKVKLIDEDMKYLNDSLDNDLK